MSKDLILLMILKEINLLMPESYKLKKNQSKIFTKLFLKKSIFKNYNNVELQLYLGLPL